MVEAEKYQLRQFGLEMLPNRILYIPYMFEII